MRNRFKKYQSVFQAFLSCSVFAFSVVSTGVSFEEKGLYCLLAFYAGCPHDVPPPMFGPIATYFLRAKRKE